MSDLDFLLAYIFAHSFEMTQLFHNVADSGPPLRPASPYKGTSTPPTPEAEMETTATSGPEVGAAAPSATGSGGADSTLSPSGAEETEPDRVQGGL